MARFRATHTDYKAGKVTGRDVEGYLGQREELARSLMKSMGQPLADGALARRNVKVQHVFPITVSNLYKVMTTEISCTGFKAIVPAAMKDGDGVTWSLTPQRGDEPIAGQGLITSTQKQGTQSTRISVTFDKLDEERYERLEVAVFDAILQRFAAM